MHGYYANHLADFVQGLSYAELPPEVVAKAKTSVLDNVGLMVGGANSAAAKAILGAMKPQAVAADARSSARRERVPPYLAALVNGTMCHSNDFTDTILLTVIHCGPVVVPTARDG